MIGPPKLYFVRNTSARRPDAFFTAFVQYLVFRYQDFQAYQFEKSLVGPKNANLIHSESRAELAFCQGLGKMTTCMNDGMGNPVTLRYPGGPDSSMVEHLVQFQKGLGSSPGPVTFHAAIMKCGNNTGMTVIDEHGS